MVPPTENDMDTPTDTPTDTPKATLTGKTMSYREAALQQRKPTVFRSFPALRTVCLRYDSTPVSAAEVLRAFLGTETADIVGTAQVVSGLEVTFKTEQSAVLAASRGLDVGGRHYQLAPVSVRRTAVSVFVPVEFPDDTFRDLMTRYGDLHSISRLHHKEPDLAAFENGCRLVLYDKLLRDLPARLTTNGASLSFKYTGQPQSCLRCSEIGHGVKECTKPRRRPHRRRREELTTEQERMQCAQEEETLPPLSPDLPLPTETASDREKDQDEAAAPATAQEHTISADSLIPTESSPKTGTEEPSPKTGEKRPPGLHLTDSPPRKESRAGSRAENERAFVKDLKSDARRIAGVDSSSRLDALALFLQHKHGDYTHQKLRLAGHAAQSELRTRWENMKGEQRAKQLFDKLYRQHFQHLYEAKGDKSKTNLVVYIFKLILWCLWTARNTSLFEKRQAEIVSVAKYKIRERIERDAAVLGPLAAYSRWGINDVLCCWRGEALSVLV
ncbi:uncharacterized protein LOC125570312 [Nematostella vectensis]|uniref:uncharacterized protein LOC125570312 n=1 Tax=Nematostella vectensis TaxID=45351 RepID=UPI002077129F|nr:uncharacterized protein LOC125570312 [Nematostella vectensis]